MMLPPLLAYNPMMITPSRFPTVNTSASGTIKACH